MSFRTAVLLLGSNLGNRKKNLAEAVDLLEQNKIRILESTEVIQTQPVEFVSDNYFCNFAAVVETNLSPLQMLKTVKKIEVLMGRLRDSREFGKITDRIIDIDIVRYDNISFYSKDLALPHQGHLNRDFSLELLARLQKTHK